MESMGAITPSTLSRSDLPWQIAWSREKCTLCGRCTAVCPVRAIEPGVFRKRTVQVPVGLAEKPGNLYSVYHGIEQRTDPAHACIGCGMCDLVCPNGAIRPVRSTETDKLRFHNNTGVRTHIFRTRQLIEGLARKIDGVTEDPLLAKTC